MAPAGRTSCPGNDWGSVVRHPKYIADFSLSLINRTGAYYVCRDVLQGLPEAFEAVRYWRTFAQHEHRGLVRKLLGRAMLMELAHFPTGAMLPWPTKLDRPVLYFDPLYVLHAELQERDIVLCHDVGPITHTSLFDPVTTKMYQRAYASIRAVKPRMIFVSAASKTAFITHYGDDFPMMEVIPLYVRSEVTDGALEPVEGVTPPFLTIGGLEVRKNHLRIIDAFQESGLSSRGYSYVFCGPRGNSAEEVNEKARTTPGVQGFGYLRDAQLRWLFRNATAFVLPSLLEGFGVPPLEAAQHGLIPIVSAGGAQEEAVGPGGLLVDPMSTRSIAEAMRYAADMPAEEQTRRVDLLKGRAADLSKETYLRRWSAALLQGARVESSAAALCRLESTADGGRQTI